MAPSENGVTVGGRAVMMIAFRGRHKSVTARGCPCRFWQRPGACLFPPSPPSTAMVFGTACAGVPGEAHAGRLPDGSPAPFLGGPGLAPGSLTRAVYRAGPLFPLLGGPRLAPGRFTLA